MEDEYLGCIDLAFPSLSLSFTLLFSSFSFFFSALLALQTVPSTHPSPAALDVLMRVVLGVTDSLLSQPTGCDWSVFVWCSCLLFAW